MESSGEDSFAWTNTSNHSSDSSAMAPNEESDFDKSFKNKLKRELFQNGNHDDSPEDESRPRKKKKKIKLEPDSPPPLSQRGLEHGDPERLLRLKLERERTPSERRRHSEDDQPKRKRPKHELRSAHDAEPLDEPVRHKKKKLKRDRRSSAGEHSDTAAAEPAADEPDADEPPPKKKKKHKDKKSKSPELIIDKFEAEETAVEARRPSPPPAPPPPAPRPRTDTGSSDAPPTIRERITFEDDESAAELDAAPAPPRAARLQRYLTAHPRLAPLPAAPPPAALLTAPAEHDDVWLLRAPRRLPAAALAGAALTPAARCRLVAAGRTYEALPAGDEARAALLLPGAGWRLRGVRVRGTLLLRERVPRARAAAPEPEPAPAAAVPLPPTRRRHPLLGSEAPGAPRRRAVAADAERRTHKNKKKKKRKRSESEAEAAPARAGRWDSERAIEENLFDF